MKKLITIITLALLVVGCGYSQPYHSQRVRALAPRKNYQYRPADDLRSVYGDRYQEVLLAAKSYTKEQNIKDPIEYEDLENTYPIRLMVSDNVTMALTHGRCVAGFRTRIYLLADMYISLVRNQRTPYINYVLLHEGLHCLQSWSLHRRYQEAMIFGADVFGEGFTYDGDTAKVPFQTWVIADLLKDSESLTQEEKEKISTWFISFEPAALIDVGEFSLLVETVARILYLYTPHEVDPHIASVKRYYFQRTGQLVDNTDKAREAFIYYLDPTTGPKSDERFWEDRALVMFYTLGDEIFEYCLRRLPSLL